jgi:hypothetical protein
MPYRRLANSSKSKSTPLVLLWICCFGVVIAFLVWFAASRGFAGSDPGDPEEICSLESVQYPVIDFVISLSGVLDRTYDCCDWPSESDSTLSERSLVSSLSEGDRSQLLDPILETRFQEEESGDVVFDVEGHPEG